MLEMDAFSQYLLNLGPVGRAFIAGLFLWAMTGLGAAVVFLKRELSVKTLDAMMGFAAGVMIAASYGSLIAPAILATEGSAGHKWFPVTFGFLLGAAVLSAIDKLLPHLHLGKATHDAEGVSTSWHRTTLLLLAITLHNIPEGLAVGVAFGATVADATPAALASAMGLAIGMGIQNVPETTAIAMPLRREGLSPSKSFWYGQLSGIVEPIAAVIGAMVVVQARSILPYALGFAAGAMMFVVIEEIIPESQRHGDTDWSTRGAMLGFALMLALDAASW